MPGLSDVTLENLSLAPREVLETVFWEVESDEASLDARFQKEEWFSSTLLEWGSCGKLAVDEEDRIIAFAEYAPPSLFPRLSQYRCGKVSADAVYLAYCYVIPEQRGRGVGSELVRAVAREVVERGYGALEALGDRAWEDPQGWVLPAGFLEVNRFTVLKDDPRFPLLRRDLRQGGEIDAAEQAEAISLPSRGAA